MGNSPCFMLEYGLILPVLSNLSGITPINQGIILIMGDIPTRVPLMGEKQWLIPTRVPLME